MANDTTVGLTWRLRAEGSRAVQSDIQRLTGSVRGARQEASRAPAMGGWRSSFTAANTEARGLWSTLTKIGGWAGIGAGALGIQASVQSFLSLDQALVALRTQLGPVEGDTTKLGNAFRALAKEVGKPAAEIAGLADGIADLDVAWKRAMEAAPKVSLLAGAIGVEDVQGVGRAFAGLEKITKGGLGVDKQLALLREMQRGTPMAAAHPPKHSTSRVQDAA